MNNFRLNFSRFLLLALPYKQNITLNVIFRVASMFFALFMANESGSIVTILSRGGTFEEVKMKVILLFCAMLFTILLMMLMLYGKASGANLDSRLVIEARKIVFSDYLKKDTSFQEATGKTLSLFENGILSWLRITEQILMECPINGIAFIIVLVYLLILHTWLFPIIVFYIVSISALMFGMQGKIEPLRKERSNFFEQRSRIFVRSIMERKIVLMYNAIDYEKKQLALKEDQIQGNVDRLALIRVPLYRVPAFLLDTIRLLVILFFAYQITRGQASVGDIVASSLAFGLLDRYFQGLIDSFQIYSDEMTNFTRLWEYLDGIQDFKRLEEGERYIPKKGEVEFVNVDFSYPKSERKAINSLSLMFAGGKKTALVGKSWAGKTTIIKLILGLLQPTEGKILIDGQNLSELRLDSYFPHIGYLPQEPSVFDGTIRENLTYGMRDVLDDAKLHEALSHARCDFVERMELGLETEIWERGVRLSGWERQRLAIARVFLRNPEILLLDEPTSALDSFSEAAITDALHELFEWKTVIVVAHRLQTVKEADSIMVLGPEGILEAGNHESLLKRGGEYAQMVDLQSGTVHDEEEESE